MMDQFDDAIKMLEQDEGFRAHVYKDTKGHMSIGIGVNLDVATMPRAVAELWTKMILEELEPELARIYPTYRVLDRVRQLVLLGMMYNMGSAGLSEFRAFLGALNIRDYARAAEELKSSLWASQVGARAQRYEYMIETGKLPQ